MSSFAQRRNTQAKMPRARKVHSAIRIAPEVLWSAIAVMPTASAVFV